jgi:signal transduction histidine kinase
VDDIVLAEAARLRARGRVDVDASGVSAGRVIGDRQQLATAVRNLVDNAERHASGSVTLTLAAQDGQVRLAVADDGPGVAEADRERVFQRFTRLDDARARDTGGAGLGLAIVKQVVEAHGGTVTVDGARFEVLLPSADGAAQPGFRSGGAS